MERRASGDQGRKWRGVPAATAWLLLIAGCLGTLANLVSPRRIAWTEDWSNYIEAKALKAGVTLVTAEQAHGFFESGSHIFLDARSPTEFEKGHIPASFSLPHATFEESIQNVQMLLSPAQPLLTYCSGENCDESFLLTVQLKDMGFTNIVLFVGGYDAWVAGGYAVQEGR